MTKAGEIQAARQHCLQRVAQRRCVKTQPRASEGGTSVPVINWNHVVIEVVTHVAVAAARKKKRLNCVFVISVDFSFSFNGQLVSILIRLFEDGCTQQVGASHI